MHRSGPLDVAVPDAHRHQGRHADGRVPHEAGGLHGEGLLARERAPRRVETAPELARVLDPGGPDKRLAWGQGEIEVADHGVRQSRELVAGKRLGDGRPARSSSQVPDDFKPRSFDRRDTIFVTDGNDNPPCRILSAASHNPSASLCWLSAPPHTPSASLR